MKVLLVGRHQAMMDTALSVLHNAGFEATGALTDDHALREIASGIFRVVTIGGGVETASRERLKSAAKQNGTMALDVFGLDDLVQQLKGIG